MSKSEMFKAAHKLAKTFVGNYRACFSLALRELRNKQEIFTLEKVGIYSAKEWFKNGNFRVYFKIDAPKIIRKKQIMVSTSFYYDIVNQRIYKTEDINLVDVIGQENFNKTLNYFLNEYANITLVA